MRGHLKLALAGIATLALTFSVLAGRSTSPPPAPAEPQESVVLKKEDRLPPHNEPLAQALAAKAAAMLKTEPEPEPNVEPAKRTVVPPILLTEDEERPRSRRHRTVKVNHSRDVCRAHKMRKVIIRGGKSWRCRK
jgi:hypothetical protein